MQIRSEEEQRFRDKIEERKRGLLASAAKVRHPALLSAEALAQGQRNIATSAWAKAWFAQVKTIADHIVNQPPDFIEKMIPPLTPTTPYTFTCPACVGRLSFEGQGWNNADWDYRRPDVVRCKACGQSYPDAKYPETAGLACPRMGQTIMFYRNPAEQKNPDDQTGKLAWHWAGGPFHVSFSGLIRRLKIRFMINGLKDLALTYRLTGEARYATRAVRILNRLSECYPQWLHHDYFDSFADCDPLYAQWHDKALPRIWKRNLCAGVFKRDASDRDALLDYPNAGRYHTCVDSIEDLVPVCLAYDLLYDAKGTDGRPLWTDAARAALEKRLILEWALGAEPYIHTPQGRIHNYGPRVYSSYAAVAQCLGSAHFADEAIKGFEAICTADKIMFDGFSHESPDYTHDYVEMLIWIPERLDGFRWPEGFPGRSGVIDLYRTNPTVRMMMRMMLDQLLPDGRFVPLSDTGYQCMPSGELLEIGLRRFPEYYEGALPTLYRGRAPGEYAVFHLESAQIEKDAGFNPPEIYFPAWMTAFLRHGSGPKGSALVLAFNPPGGHRHRDNLALYYVDRGRVILGDQGYLGVTPDRKWATGSLSHNLVVVDDADQLAPAERQPKFEMLACTPKVSVVSASSKAYAQCDVYCRLVALFKGPAGQTFAVDIFRVRGGKKHSYRLFSELASSIAGSSGALDFDGLAMPDMAKFPESVVPAADNKDRFGFENPMTNTNPPPAWQATWKEQTCSPAQEKYRMWMLSQVDTVTAASAPGQATSQLPARWVRGIEATCAGTNLASCFVVVHEPGGPENSMPLRSVTRLAVPAEAGEHAVALRVESAWGNYVVLSEFDKPAVVEDVSFQGEFGVFCEGAGGKPWIMALGATTLKKDDFGFAGLPARWSGEATRVNESEIRPAVPRPEAWPDLPKNCRIYAAVEDETRRTGPSTALRTGPSTALRTGPSTALRTGPSTALRTGPSTALRTGFPIESTDRNSLTVTRFPLQQVKSFDIPALMFVEGK